MSTGSLDFELQTPNHQSSFQVLSCTALVYSFGLGSVPVGFPLLSVSTSVAFQGCHFLASPGSWVRRCKQHLTLQGWYGPHITPMVGACFWYQLDELHSRGPCRKSSSQLLNPQPFCLLLGVFHRNCLGLGTRCFGGSGFRVWGFWV